MDKSIFSKYGEAMPIKYLVGSLDDLKDVVDTVKSIISRGCDKGEQSCLEDSITISALPIKNSLSSFILGLKMPQQILNPGNRKINWVKTEDSK